MEAKKSKVRSAASEGKGLGLAGDVFRSLIFRQLCLGFPESCDLKECVPPEDVGESFRVQEGVSRSFRTSTLADDEHLQVDFNSSR